MSNKTIKDGSVQSLRANGLTVFVRHYRYSNIDGGLHSLTECRKMAANLNGQAKVNHINPRGGKVEVELVGPKGAFRAEAVCSKDDNYNKSYGVNLALNRAFFELAKSALGQADSAVKSV